LDCSTASISYVSHTNEYALRYGKYPPILEGYSDAYWIADYEELKSTSGYVFTKEEQRYVKNLPNKHVLPFPL